jgi:hypothetical protein
VIAGNDGSVITEGMCGKAPRDGALVVVARSVVVGVVEGESLSVDGGAVPAVVGVTVVVAGGAVGVVVTADGVARSWASWSMPQTMTAIRKAMSTAQPTSAIGLRQPGTASMAADGIGEGRAHLAATHAATDQQSKFDPIATGPATTGPAAA